MSKLAPRSDLVGRPADAGLPTVGCRPCPRCGGRGTISLGFDAEALVAAIIDAVGAHEFSARELIEHARLVGGRLRVVLGGMSGRSLGRTLRKIEGIGIAGRHVERIGVDLDGIIWRVR
jgi:hypothetical protein